MSIPSYDVSLHWISPLITQFGFGSGLRRKSRPIPSQLTNIVHYTIGGDQLLKYTLSSGTLCEQEASEDVCASNPCHHSSTCVVEQESYRCLCPESRVGRNCTTRMELNTIYMRSFWTALMFNQKGALAWLLECGVLWNVIKLHSLKHVSYAPVDKSSSM